ncbi:MAG: hypothetical protein ACTSVU_06085 [Promethearchaeota archaeon]
MHLITIDYETVCLNCQQKGYNFGYSFKNIKFKGISVMDMPTYYLNGPFFSFIYNNTPMLIRNLENAHELSPNPEEPIFQLLNVKKNANCTKTKFTFRYNLQFHPKLQKISTEPQEILIYIDMYQFPNRPYFFMFYSYRNSTNHPITQINFFNIFDFDVYGQDSYDQDQANYVPELDVIEQYDSKKGLENSIFAGFGSISDLNSNFHECQTPNEISSHTFDYKEKSIKSLDIKEGRLNLRNISNWGPGDCAIGLQWYRKQLDPKETLTFPIMMVFGEGEKEFRKNCLIAREHLEKIYPTIQKEINIKSRQDLDAKLEKMSFSTREWCK